MRLRRIAFLIPAAAALLYACDDPDEHEETQSDIGDVILEGAVTDEAYVAFESALEQGQPVVDPAQAAALDQPADSAALPRSPLPRFDWHLPGSASRTDGAAVGRRTALAPAVPAWRGFSSAPPATPATPAPTAFERLAAPWLELVGPIRSAHAHGDPYSGDAFYLRFSIDSDPTLVEVFTSSFTYAPSAEAWEKMTTAGKPITLSLFNAVFEQNRVLQDGGPFTGGTITFTVAP